METSSDKKGCKIEIEDVSPYVEDSTWITIQYSKLAEDIFKHSQIWGKEDSWKSL